MTFHLGKLAALGPAAVLIVGSLAATSATAQTPPGALIADGTLTVNGSNEADAIVLRLASGAPGTLEVDLDDDGVAEFALDRSTFTRISVLAGNGDDQIRIDQVNGSFADEAITVAGGNGGDGFTGGDGAELFLGGRGDDTADGNRGVDTASFGSGDDTFVWDPGDGSDVLEGQDGFDTMVFNGAGGPEQVDLSANGSRLKLFRTQGTITMDTAGVEQVDFNGLGGADDVVVGDLTGTDVTQVNVDLAGELGGATGDGQADRIIVTGTNGDDHIDVSGNADDVQVSGLAAVTRILHSEVARDRLEINTLLGADTVEAGGLSAGAIQLLIDGVPVP